MLTKQAKVLTKAQQATLATFVEQTRSPERNRVVVLLSLRAGLRAKEIAALTWGMVTDAEGGLADVISLTNTAAKGNNGGGTIPISRELRQALKNWREITNAPECQDRIIITERATVTSAQVIVNLFADWYRRLGFDGCSSHSGRRTFITNAARNIGKFGGSLRDVQSLARHRSLAMTQRYIEQNSDAMRKVIDSL
ncbi:site-specific integrase [Sphingomonas sp. 3P27F8]|uniref:tyrosine-type recombinase/integrase n=1 Tax=Sphingomonas sp. 3P27F8 TaxID=2502213 RepID=UPI0010F9BC37|nr:site-specific integrase [Sphingomonas sp. 3P27F8]